MFLFLGYETLTKEIFNYVHIEIYSKMLLYAFSHL